MRCTGRPWCDVAADGAVQERALREQWQQGHLAVHTAEAEALRVAHAGLSRRLDEMNEMRAQIDRERGEFVRRDLYDRGYASLREALEVRIRFLEAAQNNVQGRLWAIGAAITLAVSLVVIAMNLINKGLR